MSQTESTYTQDSQTAKFSKVGPLKQLQEQLIKKPNDKSLISQFHNAWITLVSAYMPTTDMIVFPELEADQDSQTNTSSKNPLVYLKTLIKDLFIEGEWKRQYLGRYGGRKPIDQSWKDYYNYNENIYHTKPTTAEKQLWAMEFGHNTLLEYLITAKGLRLPVPQIPLLTLCCRNERQIIKILLDADVDWNQPSQGGWWPLQVTVVSSQPTLLSYFIKRGGDPNTRDSQELTPLAWAAIKGDTECTDILLEYQANPNQECLLGTTPLYWATVQGQESIVAALLEKEAALKSPYGTLLHAAVLAKSPNVITQLIEAGEDPNKVDLFGRTPLHWAAQLGNEEITELLVNHNAALNPEDSLGDKPLRLASYTKQENLISFLVRKGANT